MNQLFETASIGGMELKNRFVRSATWEAMATADGGVTPRLIDTLLELVRGEVGLIISGHAYVAKRGQASPLQMGIHDDRMIPGLEEMTGAIHREGGKIIAQLAHAGVAAVPKLSGMAPWGPSAAPVEKGPAPEEMTEGRVGETIQAFADAAFRARASGFDGVQIHAAHGYLLSQFLSPFFNRRNDRFGGPLERRAKALLSVYRAIRKTVGKDYPVTVKINSDDYLEPGFTEDQMVAVCAMLAEEGIDAIEISGGTGVKASRHSPVRKGKIAKESDEAWYRQAAERLREKTTVPLILVGGIRSFKAAAHLVENGVCDHISLSRPLIRQPDLVRRWRAGDRENATCISCNKCFKPAMAGRGIYCVVDEKEEKRRKKKR